MDSGTPGLIPNASFFLASIFFEGEGGEAVTDTVSLLRALNWMQNSGVRLVNMSFTGPSDPLVLKRIEELRALGIVFVAAAGNGGPAAEPSYPAAYPQVIAVTAVDQQLKLYASANRGDHIDLAAPGVRIWTAVPDAKEGYRSGTSFAAPFVTAVLALRKPESLGTSKAHALSHLQTVALGSGGASRSFGRGLLQAPSRCPGEPTPVSQLAPSPNSAQR